MKFTFFASILLLTTLLFTSCKTNEVQPQSQLLPNGDLEQDPGKQWSLNFRDNLTSNPNKYKG